MLVFNILLLYKDGVSQVRAYSKLFENLTYLM